MQDFVREKLAFFASCDAPLLFAKKLKGSKHIYRFRIGNYRAVFRIERSTCIFLTVKDRKDVYLGLSL
ncbi:type II toxin-antitoxin system RelE/ParE family toxin [Candidatus Uhrbacteria bacterium]|nr:type II toxin-antitoxin system RelE/ParE family toxin [Candidatus Uhrbacteria bacterium]